MNIAKVLLIGKDGVELTYTAWPSGYSAQNGDTLSIDYSTPWMFDTISEALREVRFLDHDGKVLWSTPNIKRVRETLELRILCELPHVEEKEKI